MPFLQSWYGLDLHDDLGNDVVLTVAAGRALTLAPTVLPEAARPAASITQH